MACATQFVLIGSTELERLQQLSETAQRLAAVLGQVEAEVMHPAMAAFGLWRDVKELATLADEIAAGRERPSSRAEGVL